MPCRLKRGVFRTVFDLQVVVNRFVAETNADPKPFVRILNTKQIRQRPDHRCFRLPPSTVTPMAIAAIRSIIGALEYDICVLTGDYRGKTYGPFENALQSLSNICALLRGPLYGVLGNHDSLRMTPAMEAMGIRMLFNEYETIARGSSQIYLAGVDDAHFYRADDIEKAASGIPKNSFSVLLSHTPEVYEQAAAAEFDLMLSGHTHGGQLCLPGGIPIKLEAVLPRSMGAGMWRYAGMTGYTSVGAGTSLMPVRLNCPPEISLHTLRRAE